MQEERRVNPPKLEEELYKLDDIQSFIKNERRQDELDRLHEVESQRRSWKRTMVFCSLLNIGFLFLAGFGYFLHD